MNKHHTEPKTHIGSIVVSVFFILVGLVTLYDATSYSDIDSKIFPQTVAIILILCACIALAKSIISSSTTDEGFGRGVWWRRIVLVASMILACIFMPSIGMLAAAGLAFAGGLISAMHHRWTIGKFILYTSIGITVICLFYSLFRFILLVPLP